MNINDYTGIPYSFSDYNCWQHVIAVRKDAGLDTPDFDVASPSDDDIQEAFLEAINQPKGMMKYQEPMNLDAVLMGRMYKGRMLWHSGIFYDRMVSHSCSITGQVRLDSLREIKKRFQVVEFWRK